ncbi:hypothetical protein ILYODFUR_029846 [Ilyodon furcidens]|uniref:Uncharacterized protein n=1 Tax=Ilyodon furcidens TaxID=33524 RepID=A0ABV0UXR6_9TELE
MNTWTTITCNKVKKEGRNRIACLPASRKACTRPGSESYLDVCTVRQGRQNEQPHPTAMEVSCKLTLYFPTRGCFPQRPGQLILSTVHFRQATDEEHKDKDEH